MSMKKVAIALILIILCCSLCGCGLILQQPQEDETSIAIDCGDTLTLKEGETMQLTAIVKGLSGTHRWESNDTSVVDVNANGLVRARRTGVAIISVSIGKKFAATVVTVTENKESLSVELSCSREDLLVGETATLSATVTPSKYSDLVEYHIQSGANVVSISGDTITALAEGTATIYASVNDKVSRSITIVVVDNRIIIESITLSIDKTQLRIGETATLTSTVVPSKYANLVEYFIEYNTDHATSSNNVILSGNVISAIDEGTVQIGAKIGAYRSNIVTVTIEGSTVVADSVTVSAQKYYVTEGDYTTLSATVVPSTMANLVKYEIVGTTNLAYITEDRFYAKSQGDVQVIAKVGGTISEPITIHIISSGGTPTSITLSTSATNVAKGGYATLSYTVFPTASAKDIEYLVIEGEDNVEVLSNTVKVINKAPAKIVGRIGSVLSNVIEINPNTISSDPYTGVSYDEFHNAKTYKKATSYKDAQYRTDHNLMSGDISAQDQRPTIAENRPYYVQNGKTTFYRNSTVLFLDGGNTYIVFDADGYVVNLIYKGGAYVTLEEVAAYVMAFGDVPVNYTAKKSPSPASSPWKAYLRANHSYFSGSTSSYPYEPVLPNISGCGGVYRYYEIDIGTTGTDCDPKYPSRVYNNGMTITRGAARIVYSRYMDSSKTEFTDINERYVFYTYNHYNDFQEYLNYQYGWGEMFGNITGGGTLSSKTDYNPTSYVTVAMHAFLNFRFA